MGTPEFSVPTLKALLASEHEVIGVVTQPDKPKGRGNVMQMTPVKEEAIKHHIPVYQPIRARNSDFIEMIQALAPDVVVVIAFGQILSKTFLEIPKYGCINVHASLLPKLRGAGPIQWSIINGESVTGITTMQMDAGIDTGAMLLKLEIPIERSDTGGSLHDKLSHAGGPLLLETLTAIELGTLQAEPQNNDLATHAPMLDKALGHIIWGKDAIELERLIRGLNPWPSAYTYLEGKMLKIWEAQVVEGLNDTLPGTLIDIDKDGFIIQCGHKALKLLQVQLEGKKRMTAADFLRGHVLNKGQVFTND